MKLIKSLGTAVAATAFAGAAFAADLPARSPAPVYIAPPIMTWSGFYLGANLGYGWLGPYNRANFVTDVWNGFAWVPGGGPIGDNGRGGIVGGGQVGYNYQISPLFVVGLEADLQASGVGGRGGQIFGGLQRSVGWFGTVRGRVGVTPFSPNLLVYGTGGFAYGDVRLNTLWTGGNPRATATGWSAGAGLEWAFAQNWSAKLEYLFTDIGASNWGGFNSQMERVHIHTVRAGLNYRFNFGSSAPVVAKY